MLARFNVAAVSLSCCTLEIDCCSTGNRMVLNVFTMIYVTVTVITYQCVVTTLSTLVCSFHTKLESQAAGIGCQMDDTRFVRWRTLLLSASYCLPISYHITNNARLEVIQFGQAKRTSIFVAVLGSPLWACFLYYVQRPLHVAADADSLN